MFSLDEKEAVASCVLTRGSWLRLPSSQPMWTKKACCTWRKDKTASLNGLKVDLQWAFFVLLVGVQASYHTYSLICVVVFSVRVGSWRWIYIYIYEYGGGVFLTINIVCVFVLCVCVCFCACMHVCVYRYLCVCVCLRVCVSSSAVHMCRHMTCTHIHTCIQNNKHTHILVTW